MNPFQYETKGRHCEDKAEEQEFIKIFEFEKH